MRWSPRRNLDEQARVGIVVLAIAFLLAGDRRLSPDYSKTPVLFVHGHGMDPEGWQTLIRHLVRIGYPPPYLHAVRIAPNTMANAHAAATVIQPAAEALLARAADAARRAGYPGPGPNRLDLVSHSMGAVSSRWYAARLRPDRVRTWISLAGANHGTNALCPYHDEGAREMCPAFADDPRRSVQLALNGTRLAPLDETPYGFGADPDGFPSLRPDSRRGIWYFSIRIEPDDWIKPEHSAVLRGAGGLPVDVSRYASARQTSPGNFLFAAPVDHDSLLEHPDLLGLVAALLAASDQAGH